MSYLQCWLGPNVISPKLKPALRSCYNPIMYFSSISINLMWYLEFSKVAFGITIIIFRYWSLNNLFLFLGVWCFSSKKTLLVIWQYTFPSLFLITGFPTSLSQIMNDECVCVRLQLSEVSAIQQSPKTWRISCYAHHSMLNMSSTNIASTQDRILNLYLLAETFQFSQINYLSVYKSI